MSYFRNKFQSQTMWILLAGVFLGFVTLQFIWKELYWVAGAVLGFSILIALGYELSLARAQVQTLFDNTVDGIITVDGKSIIRFFNPASEKMFGYKADEIVGRKVTCLMPSGFVEDHEDGLARYLRTGKKRIIGILVEVTGRKKNGEEFPIELGIAELKLIGKPLFTGTIRDMTDRKKLEKDLEALSHTDGLTGINNRRSFDQTLEKEWNRSTRDNQPLSLILIDIDYFKKYNDTYGHVQGDECLKTVAKNLKSSLNRAGDFLARYGGEEFVVLLPGYDAQQAMNIAEIIRKNIEDLQIAHSQNDISPFVTISLGIATTMKTHNRQSTSLVEAADKVLYEAKQEGRNRSAHILI